MSWSVVEWAKPKVHLSRLNLKNAYKWTKPRNVAKCTKNKVQLKVTNGIHKNPLTNNL